MEKGLNPDNAAENNSVYKEDAVSLKYPCLRVIDP